MSITLAHSEIQAITGYVRPAQQLRRLHEMGYPLVEGVPRVRFTDRGENGQRLGAKGGNDCWMQRVGKKAAGRRLDGVEHNGFPEVAA